MTAAFIILAFLIVAFAIVLELRAVKRHRTLRDEVAADTTKLREKVEQAYAALQGKTPPPTGNANTTKARR